MFKGSLILFLLSFCNSYIVKKSVCNNCKFNILRPNKKTSYCRISGCAYEKKRNLMKLIEPKPNLVEELEQNLVEEPKQNLVEEPDTKIEEEIESEVDDEIKKLCENYDDLIERIKIYKKAKIKKFIRKVYESVNKQLDEYN